MKKTISLVLVAAIMLTGIGNAFAYTPFNTDDPKCIDIGALNKKRWIVLPEKSGKKVCKCKTCEVTAITYDKLDEYVNNAEKEMKELDDDIRTNVKKWTYQKLQDLNKVANRELALRYIKSDIDAKNYNAGNYYFVSTNYGIGERDSIGGCASRDDVKYDGKYDDAYFNKIKNRIDEILEARKDEYNKDREAYFEMSSKLDDRESKIPVFLILGITFASGLIGAGIAAVTNKIEQAKENKNTEVKTKDAHNTTSKLQEERNVDILVKD